VASELTRIECVESSRHVVDRQTDRVAGKMASEPGFIADFVERSLERKKKAEQNERVVQQRNETRSPQGRRQTGQTAPLIDTPNEGALTCMSRLEQ